MKWGEVYWSNTNDAIVHGKGATYTVIATKDNRARLDSQCALRKNVASKFVMASFEE